MDTFEKLHDWIYLKFKIDITVNTLMLLSLLLLSIVVFIFILISKDYLEKSGSSVYIDPTQTVNSVGK